MNRNLSNAESSDGSKLLWFKTPLLTVVQHWYVINDFCKIYSKGRFNLFFYCTYRYSLSLQWCGLGEIPCLPFNFYRCSNGADWWFFSFDWKRQRWFERLVHNDTERNIGVKIKLTYCSLLAETYFNLNFEIAENLVAINWWSKARKLK